MAHHARRGAHAASRFEPRRPCSGPDPRHPLIDRPGSLRSALHLSPLSNGRKRLHETLLDFDAPDARGDRGAAGPSNRKTNENIFTISETPAMMRMVTSKGAPLEPGLFGSEEIARNEKAAKSLKTNDPDSALIMISMTY